MGILKDLNKEVFGINFKVLGLIALVILPLIFYSLFKMHKLKENKKTTMGIVTEYGPSGKGAESGVTFKYKVQEKEYTNDVSVNISCPTLEKSIKRTTYYLVVYDSLNPQNSDILIAPYQYKDYSIPVPDSLYYYW